MAFNFFKVRNGLSLGILISDPSGAGDGDMYYNSTMHKFRGYEDGAWANLIAAGTDPITLAQISTPAVPASGYDNLYFKNDDNLYIQTAAGVETPILQSGSAAFKSYQSAQVTTQSSNVGSSFTTFDNSPSFTITPTITGQYKVYCSVPMMGNSANDPYGIVRIWNTAGSASLIAESQGIFNPYLIPSGRDGSAYCQSTYTLVAGQTYIFDIQGKNIGNGTITCDGSSAPFYMFCEGIGLNGTLNTGGTTFALFTSNAVTTQGSGVTSPFPTFATFDNSPAFTFTPTISGKYKIYCSIPLENAGTNQESYAQIINTSGGATLLSNNQAVTYANATGAVINSVLVQAVYNLVAGTPYVFDIQGATSGGTAYARGDVAQFYMYAEGIGLANTSQNFPVKMKAYGAFSGSGPIICGNVSYDSNSAYNPSTGEYTVPYDGDYVVGFSAQSNSGGIIALPYVNGNLNAGAPTYFFDTSGQNGDIAACEIHLGNLHAGDVVTWNSQSSTAYNANTSFWIYSVNLAQGLIGPSGRSTGSAFAYFASSIINTIDTGVTNTSFQTFSNSPGFTVTPTTSGIYKIYSSVPFQIQDSAEFGQCRVWNTSGGATLLQESQGTIYSQSGSPEISNQLVQSVYVLNAGTTYVFDLQGQSQAGTVYARGDEAPFYMFCEGIGLNGQFQAPVTPWQELLTFTPSASFGSVSGAVYQTRVVGDTLEVKGYFTTGTVTGATASLALPTGYTIDSSKLNANGSILNGNGIPLTTSTAFIETPSSQVYPFYDGSDTANIYFANQTGSGAFVKAVASNFISSTEIFNFEFSVPISGLYGGQLDGVSTIVRSNSTGVFPFTNSLVQILDSGGVNPIKVTIATNGGDVLVGLGADLSVNPACVFIDSVGDDSGYIYFYRDGSQVAVQQMSMQTNLTYNLLSIPSSSFSFIDSPPAGTHVYTAYVTGGNTNRGNQGIYYTVLYAKPLSAIGGGGGASFELATPYSPALTVNTILPDIGHPVYFASADQPSISADSDAFYAGSGSVPDVSASGNSGTTTIQTGAVTGTGYTGAMFIKTGNATGAGATGAILITSGNSTAAGSGNVSIETGSVVPGQTAGAILLAPGQDGSNNYGQIVLVGPVVYTTDAQVLVGSDTIRSQLPDHPISSASAVTVSTIETALNVGQILVLTNSGAYPIIIPQAAGVYLPYGQNFTLNPNRSISFISDASLNWVATCASEESLATYLPAAAQTLTAGFTIAFAGTNTYLPVTSAGPVTSDPTTIIAAGVVTGQSVIIENQGSNTITLKAGGNVKLPQGVDYPLNQYGIISLIWNGTVWNTLSASANG